MFNTIFKVTSKVVVDKEHGVTNEYTAMCMADSEKTAKAIHKEQINERFGKNFSYGGVFKQTAVES